MSCILDFLLYATTMADCEYNYRLCQLASRVGVIKIVIVMNCNLITFSKVIACNCN